MKRKIMYFIFLFLITLVPEVVLANSIKSEIILTKEDITQGEIVKATVKLNQEENDTLTVLKTKIEYDENIFELVEESKIKGANGWSSIVYNPETHAIVTINKYGSTLNEDIFTFELKLKSSAIPSKTAIKLEGSSISSATKKYDIEESDAKIGVNLTPSQLVNKDIVPNYGKQLSNEPVKLYYILTIIVMELVIAIILVLIYHAVMKKRMLSSKDKYKLITVLTLIEIVSFSAFFGFDTMKGDLNGDKMIDYKDVEALSNHLANTKKLSNYRLEKADLDGDGIITTKDVALLVERSFKRTTYEAKLANSLLEENGYEKSSTVELKFLANVTNDEKIAYVLIDGKKYKVERSDSTNEYTVKLETSNISNKYNYNIDEVILANGRSAKVDYDTSIVVLKDIPKFTNFATKEDVENGKMNVAFTIEDFDDAITEATYELTKKSGNLAMKGKISKGKNTLSLPLENAVDYKLSFKILYNRGEGSGEHFGAIEDSFDLKLITDYKFKIGVLNLTQDGKVLKDLAKDKETFIEFTSTNISNYSPKKITMNSREYTVTNLGNNRYRVRIPNTVLTGEPLTISSVTLSNGKQFKLNEKIPYNVLSYIPKIEKLDYIEDTYKDELSITLNTIDEDKTVKKYKITLEDLERNLISTAETDKNEVKMKTSFASKYRVKVYATYDLGYGNIYKDSLIYEEVYDAKIKALLKDAKPNEIYPDKNSVILLNYVITSNHGAPVKEIVIDNIIYPVKKVDIDTYQVEKEVGEISGVKTFNAEKIIFENDEEFKIENTIKVDILKDMPFIENFKLKENFEDNRIELTFDLYDLDSAFTGGSILLNDKADPENTVSKDIIPGKNTITFEIEKNKKYSLQILVDAVLDTKELNENTANIVTKEELYKMEYGIVDDYDLSITDITTDKKYYEKGESMTISFKSENSSEFYPLKIKVDGTLYDLEKVEDTYRFKLEAKEEAGTDTLSIESIILNNYSEIRINCTKNVEILKSAPTIEDLKLSYNESSLIIEPVLKDDDATLENIKTIIKTLDGNILKEQASIEPILLDKNIEDYQIDILATYKIPNIEEKKENITIFSRTVSKKDKKVDIQNLNYNFKIGETITKTLSKDLLLDTSLIITENESDILDYSLLKYEITGDQRLLAKILAKDYWFIENGISSTKIELEIGIIENNIVHLK